MDERRSERRKLLSYFSRVVERDSGYLLGYLVDLTTGGAMMVGNIYLEPNSPLSLRLDLPEDFTPQEKLDLEVLTVWSRPDQDPELYRTGLRLVDIKPADLLILEKLLNLHSSSL